MNIKKTFIAGASAAMLLTSPAVAQAQADRAAVPAEEGEQLFGGNLLLSLLVIAGVITAIILIADDDDVPVSP